MTLSDQETDKKTALPPPVAVIVRVIRGKGAEDEKRFTAGFIIGRSGECDLPIAESSVSRQHLRIDFDTDCCWIRDLGSANGTFINGERMHEAPLNDTCEVELGEGGALLSFRLEREAVPEIKEAPVVQQELTTETQIIKRYFDKKSDEDAGEHTMMFRRAFQRVHKKKSRKYQVVIAMVLLLLLVSGGVIFQQTQKIKRLRATAEGIFYSTKNLELQISKLEDLVLLKADPQQVAELKEKRLKLRDMEKEYDNFVKELGIYKKAPEDEQLILRVARTFGECDVNAPKGFVDEVRNYIQAWKKTDRLRTALNRAKEKGYGRWIGKIFEDNNLLPHYFFLALQESNFDERAVGPETRYGYAKGMWQFIAQTAQRYGLQTGPLQKQPVYDPQDDRFEFIKATAAAAKYIKDISDSEAQASGLLVMASYNWGEGNVRQIILKMPETPRERNFWRFLEQKNVPKETYDYVFSIVSAAVICENPKFFGFDNLPCPEIKSVHKTKETKK